MHPKLKMRMASLEREIAAHASDLGRHQWDQISDHLEANLRMKKTWQLLKRLFDPNLGKTELRNRLTQAMHNYAGSGTELRDENSRRIFAPES